LTLGPADREARTLDGVRASRSHGTLLDPGDASIRRLGVARDLIGDVSVDEVYTRSESPPPPWAASLVPRRRDHK